MKITQKIIKKNIKTCQQDGRKSLSELYKAQITLKEKDLWEGEEILIQKVDTDKNTLFLPVNGIKTSHKGLSLWLLSGIHGEEPAGPNAIEKNIETLEKLGQKIPVVILPLCNPAGYFRNCRYFNTPFYSESLEGKSVGDSEHLILNISGRQARSEPSSRECEIFTEKILEIAKDYPPLLVIDLHEDDFSDRGYIYSGMYDGLTDPVACEIIKIFKQNNFPIHSSEKTRFHQEIIEGIISSASDGSIDELLRSKEIFFKGKICPGPSAKHVIVVETGARNVPLEKRVIIHSEIIKNLEQLWDIASKA